jgi:hypothetical protein
MRDAQEFGFLTLSSFLGLIALCMVFIAVFAFGFGSMTHSHHHYPLVPQNWDGFANWFGIVVYCFGIVPLTFSIQVAIRCTL